MEEHLTQPISHRLEVDPERRYPRSCATTNVSSIAFSIATAIGAPHAPDRRGARGRLIEREQQCGPVPYRARGDRNPERNDPLVDGLGVAFVGARRPPPPRSSRGRLDSARRARRRALPSTRSGDTDCRAGCRRRRRSPSTRSGGPTTRTMPRPCRGSRFSRTADRHGVHSLRIDVTACTVPNCHALADRRPSRRRWFRLVVAW